MQQLNLCLLGNKSITDLNLSHCALTNYSIKQLESGLRKNRTLHNLHLFANPGITDDSLKLFIDILEHDNTIL